MPGMDIGKKGLECYVGVMIFHKMNSENENSVQKFEEIDLILKPAITLCSMPQLVHHGCQKRKKEQ